MAFNITRNAGGKPVFKSVTSVNDNSLLNLLLDRKSAGSESVLLQSLTIGSVPIDNNVITALTKATVTTKGVALPSKVLTASSSRNVSGINRISCSQVYINDVLLDPTVFTGGAVSISTQDASRSELTGLVAGKATASKALVLDNLKKIEGINRFEVEAIETPDGEITVNRKNNVLSRINTVNSFNHINTKTIINNTFGSVVQTYSNVNLGPTWICYSDDLDTYVGVFSDNYIRYSKNLLAWTNAITDTTISYVNFFPETSKFVAVGANKVFSSNNGITWTSRRISNKTFVCIEYSPFLQMYVAGGSGSSPWYSYDLIKWYYSEGPTGFGVTHIKWVGSSKRFIGGTSDWSRAVIWSIDGKKWDVLPTCPSPGQQSITMIDWSPELNIVVCATGSNPSRLSRLGFYSKDGGLSFKPFYSNVSGNFIQRLRWQPEINMFIAVANNNLGVSLDGINWKFFNHASSDSYTNFYLIRKTMQIYFTCTSSSSVYRMLAGPINSAFSSPLWHFENSKVSFNTTTTSAMLNIGSETSTVARFSDEARNFTAKLTLTNGVAELNATSIQFGANININGGDDITPKIFRFLNKVTNSTYYKPKDYLVTSSGGNINHPGYLSATSVTVNGTAINTSDNAAEFTNNQIGIANASKFMLTDLNGSIKEVNKVGAKQVKIDNYLLTSGSLVSVDLAKKNSLTLKEVGIGACSVFNNFLTTSAIWGTHVTGDNPFYIKELDLLIVWRSSTSSILYKSFTDSFGPNLTQSYTITSLCGNNVQLADIIYIKETGIIYYLTSAGLFYTKGKDLFDWKNTNFMSFMDTQINSVDYSPKLDLTVACLAGGIMISKNGTDFKNIPDNRFSESLQLIKWIPSWSMFVAITRAPTNGRRMFISSKDGINWDHQEYSENITIRSGTIPTQLIYSPKLDLLIARTSTFFYYTNNGTDWKCCNHPFNAYNTRMIWIPELEIFATGSGSAVQIFMSYSYDGINWLGVRPPAGIPSATYSNYQNGPVYIKSQNMLLVASSGTTAGVIGVTCSNMNMPQFNPNDCVVEDNMTLDIVNNRVGLAVSSPQYSLHLGEDLAFKPTSSAWATSSDERLKEDIVTADYSMCADVIKSIPVKEFTLTDRQLGWIAQDVEQIIPKAVSKCNFYGLSDCRSLNNDQIVANLYGAIKWLINKDKSLDSEYFEI